MRNKPLPVVITPTAAHELWQIYEYNLEQRGRARADKYDAFLAGGIGNLATDHKFGKVVKAMPDLRYLILKRSSKGDGHVIVFSVGNAVEVLHVFHTKRDWPNQL